MEDRVKELEENQNINNDDFFSQFIGLPIKSSENLNFDEEMKWDGFGTFNPSTQFEFNKKSSPLKAYSNSPINFHDVKDQEYASSDELMHMLKFGVDKKFKSFLESCEKDIKEWKENARKEVEHFSNFMNFKHNQLKGSLADQLSEFTPVLNGKF